MDFSYKDGSRTYKLTVEKSYEDKLVERYKVHAKNNPGKYIMATEQQAVFKKQELKA